MVDTNGIPKNLAVLLKSLESDVSKTTHRFKDVEKYINKRARKLQKLVPLIAKSKNWNKLFDLYEEIQKILEKVEDLEGSIKDGQEVPFSSEEIVSLMEQEEIND